jgi:hypothetical protein
MRVLVLLAMIGVLLSACGPPRDVPTAGALRAAPNRFYDRPIVVAGQVQALRSRSPEHGNSYTYFEIADGTARLPVVYGMTLADVGSGDLVEVRGVYRAVLHAGTDTYRDALEAEYVRRLRAAGQPPGTPSGPP